MERVGKPPEDQREDPPDERGDERHDRPQQEPDDVRDGEEEPEEHGESRSLEVVVHDDPHGMVGQLRVRLGEIRIRGRIARREEEQVRARLRGVAERERRQVAESARRASSREDREPGEEGGCGGRLRPQRTR